MKKILTIAGFDPSGGAGLQADLKTFTVHKTYGMSVVTSIVVQNTRGVQWVEPIPPALIQKQLEVILEDIVPDAIKIGLISSVNAIQVIGKVLQKNPSFIVVLDPVSISSSGHYMVKENTLQSLQELLFPLSSLVTPNITEAEAICDFSIQNKAEMAKSARKIAKTTNGAVLLKGGHASFLEECSDVLVDQHSIHWFCSPRIQTLHTHGSGCTLSSAIAAHLGQGDSLITAIEKAKAFVSNALLYGIHHPECTVGKGNSPLNHSYLL
jgi:hydroxymethylpyrimidine/phosphomethylpyrimidine kinase